MLTASPSASPTSRPSTRPDAEAHSVRVVCRFRPLAATDPRADAPADAPFELAQHSVRDHRGVGGAGARLYGRFDAVLGPDAKLPIGTYKALEVLEASV